MSSNCKIFVPYRAVGLVSNEIPLVVRYIKRRKENLIVTVIGNVFHTYSSSKLALVSVGNAHTNPISCMTADTYHIYTACDKTIYAWRRGVELKHKYRGHSASISLMMPFGPHLISIDQKNILRIWDIKSEELYSEVEFPVSFCISSILHPATYINKILLGSTNGTMQLWNIKTNTLIYSFSGFKSEIIVLEQAPALDVVAIGLSDGRIILHNLKYDETIVEFKQDWGKVTAITFRTDDTPIMATGSPLGHIALWDLNDRRLSSQIQNAHAGPITGLTCLPNEPLMVTSSSDNSLKMWIFDLPDGGGRLLKMREGHSGPPLAVKFHGSLGNNILTGGEDSTIRLFSTINDVLNCSLGVASYNRKAAKRKGVANDNKKMSSIVAFTSETSQEKPWDNIAAIHKEEAVVTTWSIKNRRMGDHMLKHERFKYQPLSNAVATCVELSVCGNFVFIGYDSGHMDKFNIQSGIHRGSFGKNLAHQDSVRDIVADGLNSTVISGGQEGWLTWWKLKDCSELFKLNFEVGISQLILNRDSGLLAVVLDDWSISVVDVDTRNVIRKYFGHYNQITDVTISPDSTWIISSSLDRSIRTWDLPSGMCVDHFCVPTPATSISISPTAEFLATIHAEHLGVYLWTNKKCFQHINLWPLPDNFEPVTLPLPSTGANTIEMPAPENQEDSQDGMDDEIKGGDEYISPEQISEELVTLALIPTSRWLNLLNLDVIKKRNKPTEPPKATKAAPFFIPTIPGLEFKLAEPNTDSTADDKSHMKSVTLYETTTKFMEALNNENYDAAIKMLLEMGPSSIEVEIKGLDPDAGGTDALMLNFLRMIEHGLSKCIYYEAIQGYFSLYLKIHSEFIINNALGQELCKNILNSLKNSWYVIKKDLNQSLSLISYFKNSALINY